MENIETICVHTGTLATSEQGVNTPIYTSSAYPYRNAEENTYPRYFNTINQKAIVQKLCALEGAEDGLLMSSGMAAISTTLFSLLKPGDHCVFSNELYGGTINLIVMEFAKLGIEYSFFDKSESHSLERAIQENSKAIYIETPSNPLLSIIDLEHVVKVAKAKKLITVIDNTFATPINQTPLKLGIDVVVHSGTKYLAGHSDLCFGAVLSRKEIKERILKSALNFGGSVNPLDCYMIERSLKTLALRVAKHNENAQAIAEFLERHPKVEKVNYPGLPSHRGYSVAKSQMKGFGGMLSFEVNSARQDAVERFLDRLSVIQPALSLGGVESLICVTALSSHVKLSKTEREKIGISEGL
jgi:cystathionine beta-lyase